MSPASNHSRMDSTGFPRVSGDEPDGSEGSHEAFEFSPRERG